MADVIEKSRSDFFFFNFTYESGGIYGSYSVELLSWANVQFNLGDCDGRPECCVTTGNGYERVAVESVKVDWELGFRVEEANEVILEYAKEV